MNVRSIGILDIYVDKNGKNRIKIWNLQISDQNHCTIEAIIFLLLILLKITTLEVHDN